MNTLFVALHHMRIILFKFLVVFTRNLQSEETNDVDRHYQGGHTANDVFSDFQTVVLHR